MSFFGLLVLILFVIIDVSYFVRTFFTVFISRFNRKHNLEEVTTIYGLGTYKDCDIFFKSIRLARLVRELDFARFHFYDRTGIYQRSRQLAIKSLQRCTLTLTMEPVPLFCFYKINTKLVYWDETSLFFEHEVITLYDGRVRCFLVSRQHAIGDNASTDALLQGLPGSEIKPDCPDYIKIWLETMKFSSVKLRDTSNNKSNLL